MTSPPDFDAIAHNVGLGAANLRQMVEPIAEAAAGYRRKLEADGWSPTAAETIALSFHDVLMAQMLHSVKGGGS